MRSAIVRNLAIGLLMALLAASAAGAAVAREIDLSKGCASLWTLRSGHSRQPVSLTFRNKTTTDMTIVAIDPGGKMRPVHVLLPREVYRQKSHLHDAWLINNPGGDCYGAFLATGNQTITTR